MGVLDRLFERRTLSATSDGYYVDALPGLLASLIPSGSGITVTEDVALTFTAYWACVKVISETMAMIPCHMYQHLKPRGKKRATDHYLYPLLHDQPNPEMTAFAYQQLKSVHLLTWGNFYANIVRDSGGRVLSLWPLNPRKMIKVTRDKEGLLYIYQLPSGEKRKLRASEVYHEKGLSTDGYVGLSPVGQNREAIGLGMSHTQFSNAFYKNGTNIGTVLYKPGRLGEEGRKNITESIEKYHAGLTRSHRLLVLDEDMKIEKLGMPLKDAQHLEAAQYNLQDMCRIHRLQLHKVGDYAHANFSNVEQLNIEFHTDTCLPWAKNSEQEIKRQLIQDRDKQTYFAEYLMDMILRGDIKTRYSAYNLGIGNGFLSENDVRDKENMNPLLKPDGSLDPAGDEYWRKNIWTKVGEAAPAPIGNEEKQAERMTPVQIVMRDERTAPAVPVEVVTENRKASPAARNKTRKIFVPLFKDFGDKIVHIEVTDIRRAIDKYFPKRNTDGFIKRLDGFYKKFPDKISKHMMPLIQSYGSAIIEAANKEVGGSELDAKKVREFNAGYIELFIKRYVSSSRGQLEFVADEKRQASIDDDLMERLNEWEQKRPDKIATRETVEASDAFAKLAFLSAGVTKLIWVAQGAKPCPYCENLNGTVMGIEQNFIDQGTAYEPEGADGSMKIYSPCSHAPLHGGCVCTIVPE